MKLPPLSSSAAPVPNTTGGQEVSIVFASRAALLAFGVLTQSLLAYTLRPEGRGAYAVCIMFTVLLGMFLASSADRGAQYLAMTKQLTISQSTAIALTIGIATSLLAALVSVPLIHSGLGLFQKADTRSFYIALGLIPLTSTSSIVELMLAGFRRFTRMAVVLLLKSTVILLATITLVWGLSFGVNGAIVSVALGNLLMSVVGLWYLHRHCGLSWEMPSRLGLRRVLAYGFKYHIARMGSESETRIIVLITGFFASSSEVGLMAVASVLAYRLMIISRAVGTTLYPRVAGGLRDRPGQCALSLRLVLMLTATALLVLLLFLEPIVSIVFSKAFLPAVPLIYIMGPGVVAYAAGGMFSTYFLGTNRPGICSWSISIGIIVNVVSLPLLYSTLGLEGAAWAVTLSLFCQVAYLAVMFRLNTRMPFTSTWLPRLGDIAFLWAASRSLVIRTLGGATTCEDRLP